MRVAFLGLGRMGRAMASHLPRTGHEVTVWNRTPGRAGELVEAGATEAPDVAAAVRDAEVVVVMVADPAADREVLEQVASAAPQGAVVVDATTIGPDDARAMATLLAQHGISYLDAPVAGTVGPAAEGTLGVLVGGSEADVERVRPLLELWGDPAKVRRVGDVGSGAALKLVVNLGLGVAAQGVGESLRLADTLGLDRGEVLDALAQGHFVRLVTQKRELLASGGAGEPMFTVDLLAKDLGLILDVDPGLPATAAARTSALSASEQGRGGQDYASLALHVAGSGGSSDPVTEHATTEQGEPA